MQDGFGLERVACATYMFHEGVYLAYRAVVSWGVVSAVRMDGLPANRTTAPACGTLTWSRAEVAERGEYVRETVMEGSVRDRSPSKGSILSWMYVGVDERRESGE